jgi:hypothetical protein
VIYAVPGSGPADAQIFSRQVGSSTSSQLDSGVAASNIPAAGNGASDVVIYGTTHGPDIFQTSEGTAPAPLSASGFGNNNEGSVLLQGDGDVYVQQSNASLGSSAIVEVQADTGSVVATYNLPLLRPDSIAGVEPSLSTGLTDGSGVNGSTGTVQALILDNGSLYALQFTGRAAAIDNLSAGKVQYLAGYGDLGGGALAPDGDIYVVGWRQNGPTAAMRVLQIDPNTLDTDSTFSTGLYPPTTLNVQMQANSSDDMLVYISQGNETDPIESNLWGVSASGLVSLGALPANVGLYMSDFGPTVYLYGGKAENAISSVDLSDEALTQGVSGISAPQGSYVLAVS